MWCFYVFNLIAFVSAPQALQALLHGDFVTFVAWLSSNWLQLILLPALMVGQRTSAAADDLRALTDHETLQWLAEIQNTQLVILQELQQRASANDGQTPR